MPDEMREQRISEMLLPAIECAPEPLAVALELPPPIEQPLRNLEMAIFNTYASSSDRAEAFDLLLDLQVTLHRGITRASLVKPKRQTPSEQLCDVLARSS